MLLLQLYSYVAPENFETSKISLITNEQLSIKLKDLLSQPEISKYPLLNTEENLLKIIDKYCEFFTLSTDKTEIQYVIPDNSTIFSILNIPQKLTKDEVKHHLELINLQYNRLYKKGFYWFLSTTDKETVICVQNSLRELRFDEIKVKYFHSTKNQIVKNMKEKVDKAAYQKDVKYLGYNANNNKGKNFYNKKHKNSDYSDSSNFSWRKGSGASDYDEKYTYKKNKYYKYKRNRFNSDNDRKYISNNNNNNADIEIDISKLKYDLNIKNKYTFQEIKNFFEKMNKTELTKPKFIDEELTDIISDKIKEIVSLNELVEINDKIKKNENEKIREDNKDKKEGAKQEEKKSEKDNKNNNNTNTNIKIPKMNPLSGMSKNFNKFDIVPGNAMPGMMMPFSSTTWIPGSTNEQ